MLDKIKEWIKILIPVLMAAGGSGVVIDQRTEIRVQRLEESVDDLLLRQKLYLMEDIIDHRDAIDERIDSIVK